MKISPPAGVPLALILAGMGFLGCQHQSPPPAPPPDTNYSGKFLIGPHRDNYIGVIVSRVGPPTWCYILESFDTVGTNLPTWNLKSPMPGAPNGHPSGVGFTNLTLAAAQCTVTNLTPGWQVNFGTNLVLFTTNLAGTSRISFCLECDKTNGSFNLTLKDAHGNTVPVGPIAGPQ